MIIQIGVEAKATRGEGWGVGRGVPCTVGSGMGRGYVLTVTSMFSTYQIFTHDTIR